MVTGIYTSGNASSDPPVGNDVYLAEILISLRKLLEIADRYDPIFRLYAESFKSLTKEGEKK